jgi:hypothetical protein
METTRTDLFELAATQHGLVAARQALEIVTEDQMRQLLRRGVLEKARPGVLRVRGSAATPLQELAALPLAASRRAALSHGTALAHWGVRGFVTSPVHLVRHRDIDDRAVPEATIHEVRFLPWTEIRSLEGIPVVSPSLALLQLSGLATVSDRKLGAAIDAAWSDRLVTHSTLTAIDRRMSRQGRRGIVRFRAAVEERGPGYTPPASNLERRFADLLERAGREPLDRQVDVSGEDGWIGRVDFKDRRRPLVVEIQSERFHRGLTAEAQDRERIARLNAAGVEVVELTDEDVWYRADHVVRVIDAKRTELDRLRAA